VNLRLLAVAAIVATIVWFGVAGASAGGNFTILTVATNGTYTILPINTTTTATTATPVNTTTKTTTTTTPTTTPSFFPCYAEASIRPREVKVRPGGEFEVAVYVELLDVEPAKCGVSGGEVKIRFNPFVLKVVDVRPGDLLGSNPLEGYKRIDNERGEVVYALARVGKTPVPTPNGTFAYIKFKATVYELLCVNASALCVNAYEIGLNASLADQNFRDMVVYSKGGRVIIVSCPGDINGDNCVDYKDLAILGASYGKCRGDPDFNPLADLNGDGCVDYKDLAILGSRYGICCLQ